VPATNLPLDDAHELVNSANSAVLAGELKPAALRGALGVEEHDRGTAGGAEISSSCIGHRITSSKHWPASVKSHSQASACDKNLWKTQVPTPGSRAIASAAAIPVGSTPKQLDEERVTTAMRDEQSSLEEGPLRRPREWAAAAAIASVWTGLVSQQTASCWEGKHRVASKPWSSTETRRRVMCTPSAQL